MIVLCQFLRRLIVSKYPDFPYKYDGHPYINVIGDGTYNGTLNQPDWIFEAGDYVKHGQSIFTE